MRPGEGSIALVTGGARGLGVEVCRQLARAGLTVWLTARDGERAADAAAALSGDGDVRPALLDVADPGGAARLADRMPRLDVLVNNAAIDYDADQQALTADLDRVERALGTNLFGAWRTAQAFAPHLRSSPHGRLVNVSSEGGSVASSAGGLPAYHLSKLALNGLTRMLAAELSADDVLVNAVCPGWTATDMGGGGRPVPEGARSVTWACLLDDGGPTGGFFRDGRPLPW
ncbi:SDR family NAD(P)-dependent oxidoreductase [Streptomyces sp. NPDC001380]|uniref:SDR family NAD(P)-dependent oxidoreductase n=1 Tax=Streptomyces sp. NPDC001380 TaxID=3364566 RepID=UPI0036D136D9